MFFGELVLALYLLGGVPALALYLLNVFKTRTIIAPPCGTSATRRMSSAATRTRVKQKRWRNQSWRVVFSDQKSRPISCRASMTCDDRRENQRRNLTLRRAVLSLSGGPYLVFCEIDNQITKMLSSRRCPPNC